VLANALINAISFHINALPQPLHPFADNVAPMIIGRVRLLEISVGIVKKQLGVPACQGRHQPLPISANAARFHCHNWHLEQKSTFPSTPVCFPQ
jgi:hypothetical protein